MLSDRVVRMITDYLDECATLKREATLVGMHWYVDSHNKTLPTVEEVNAALRQRPSFLAAITGNAPLVSEENMRQADREYRKEFSEALKRLRSTDA